MSFSAVALVLALAVAVAGFVVQRMRLAAFRPPAPLAPPRGSAAAGVLYAFTTAFAPGAKESASRHLPSYVAGIVYHLSIFAALARLLTTLLPMPIPPAVDAAGAVLFAFGLACGLALLVKRLSDGKLRALSVPEDLLANLLVDVMVAAALAASLKRGLVPFFQITGALLVLYAPLGKLRHMLFLLTSRWYLGAYFGRRGVRPAPHGLENPRG